MSLHSVILATTASNCSVVDSRYRRNLGHLDYGNMLQYGMSNNMLQKIVFAEFHHTYNYWYFVMRTYCSSTAEVALASHPSTNLIKGCIPSATVIGWTNTGFSFLPTLVAVSFGPCLRRYVSFHIRTTVSVTEIFCCLSSCVESLGSCLRQDVKRSH